MKRALAIALGPLSLAIALGLYVQPRAAGEDRPNIRPRISRSDGAARMSRSGQDSFAALCDAVQAGDKAGAWDCIKGDGTMASGSATTWVATGTPTNSTFNGFPMRTYTAGQNDQQPSAAAFPASDFSVCKHHRSADLAATYEYMTFGGGALPAASASVLAMEQTITIGNMLSYSSNGAAYTSVGTSTGNAVAGTWALWCFTYQRVGGASNNVGTLYKDGVQVAQSSTMNLVQALASQWSTNGSTGATNFSGPSSMRGAFVTYKLLSAADVQRITAAVGP